MTIPDDEDNFIEADLQQQRDTPPLSRKPDDAQEPAPVVAEQDQAEPDDTPEQAAEPSKPKYVPHAKFNEVNERLKEERRRGDLIEHRTNLLLQTMQQMAGNQQPQQEAQRPDLPPEDPVERIDWLTKKFEQNEKTEQQRQQYTRQQQEWDSYASQVSTVAGRDFQRAIADDPGLQDMYNFVVASRMGELMASGGVSQQQAETQLRIEEVQGYGQAYQNGRTPDQVIRALAQARGYRPNNQNQPAANQQPTQITQERRNQHRSLSQLGGREGPSALTAKDLGNMTEDEFSAVPERIIKSLMNRR